MNISLKSESEIEKMRVAGRLAAEVLEMIAPHVQHGVTTLALDEMMQRYIEDEQHAISACLGYHGYPRCTCISVNEEICHGIPGARVLHRGDIVNIDVTVIKDGFHGDTSRMFIVGDHTAPVRLSLCRCTQTALYEAIKLVRPGADLTEVGDTIQRLADHQHFSVVREFCGHGIGISFHEDPQVLHFRNNSHLTLKEGMTFTIEPMINMGTHKCRVSAKNGWTATTADRQPSAQWEHTLLVTADGVEVLTLRSDERFPRIIRAGEPVDYQLTL
ncbi:MAG: type I methionyl aminopeptidase [Succinivibrionaceae bacterium]|nr:type I methionyl aminopeptidase [Succinivibrionaceae bacterium]